MFFTGKPNNENDKNSKLEQLVNEVIIEKRKKDEKRFSGISENRFSGISEQRFSGSMQETIIGFPHDNVYNHSYQEALNR